MVDAVQLDWTSPGFLADPYPFYHRLRAADPIHRHESGFWLVTRYADAMAMLRDPRFVRPSGLAREQLDALIEAGQLSARGFLFHYGILWQNPPEHTRLRRLLKEGHRQSLAA